jgi:hypothetical protein
MKSDIVEQVRSILEDIDDPEGFAEVEKVIEEVKGRLASEEGRGFWEEKTPCWEMCHCAELVRSDCPAFREPYEPCWTVEGTYCKVTDYGTRGDDTSICAVCRVYKRWGAGQPIELRVHAKAKEGKKTRSR